MTGISPFFFENTPINSYLNIGNWVRAPWVPTYMFNLGTSDKDKMIGDTFVLSTNSNNNISVEHTEEAVEKSGVTNPASSGLEKCARENDYDEIINDAAKEFGIAPALIKAVIRKESTFDAKAKSKYSTASGLMQMLKGTYEACFKKINPGKPIGSPFDPRNNIRAGAYYLKELLNQFNGDVAKAVLAYNQGYGGANSLLRQGKTDKGGYVKKVMEFYNAYKKCLTT